MNQEQALLNVKQLSQALNVPVTWIYQKTSQNQIPFVKVGKYVRFNLSEVLDFLRNKPNASLSQNYQRPTINEIVGEN